MDGAQWWLRESSGTAHELPPVLAHILAEVRRQIGWSYQDSSPTNVPSDLEASVASVAERLGFELSSIERDEIVSHLENDWSPFGVLQPLVDDPGVTDIIVTNHNKIVVQQGRKNFVTGITFPDQDSYEALVEKLLLKANASCTTKQPIADAMLGSHARIHVVHKSICESGPYLTIRLNRFPMVSLEALIDAGLAPEPVFNYLKAMVSAGNTLLICGEVGTGKTTLARALASTVPAEESVLVIEDTPEIRLEHPHVRYVSTRGENNEGEGRVSPAQCIRAGMRMAMNRIIFGEIRDAEAAEAFVDVCASGHPGMSTMHARSAAEALTRMELFLGRAQRGVERSVIAQQTVTAVQAIVIVEMCRVTNRRRIVEVRELGPVADGAIRQREIFGYEVVDGLPQWKVTGRVSAHRDVIERCSVPCRLSELPALLELPLTVSYRETAASLRRVA